MPAHHFPVGSSMTTLHLCSDGTYLYWIWAPGGLNEKTQKGHSVFMDFFHLSVGIRGQAYLHVCPSWHPHGCLKVVLFKCDGTVCQMP